MQRAGDDAAATLLRISDARSLMQEGDLVYMYAYMPVQVRSMPPVGHRHAAAGATGIAYITFMICASSYAACHFAELRLLMPGA